MSAANLAWTIMESRICVNEREFGQSFSTLFFLANAFAKCCFADPGK